jgi:hypothetical protein
LENTSRFVQSLQRDFGPLINEAETLSFLSRDADLQRDALAHLDQFLARIAVLKATVRGDEANACLAVECLARALAAELRMWLALKNERPAAAWEELVTAQYAAASAVRAHPIGANAIRRQPFYDALEQIIFGPQMFLSTGYVAEEEECSICNCSYDNCPHILGRAYDGTFCSVIVRKARPREVSIVSEPADKRCRVMSFGDGEKMRDKLTWKLDEPKVRR